jgi:hypothetical protein
LGKRAVTELERKHLVETDLGNSRAMLSSGSIDRVTGDATLLFSIIDVNKPTPGDTVTAEYTLKCEPVQRKFRFTRRNAGQRKPAFARSVAKRRNEGSESRGLMKIVREIVHVKETQEQINGDDEARGRLS